MKSITVNTGWVFLFHPVVAAKMVFMEGSVLPEEIIKLILDHAGKVIYNNVEPKEEFMLVLVNDNQSKSLRMQRLPDEQVSVATGNRNYFGEQEYKDQYSFRVKLVNSDIVWDLPQYKYASSSYGSVLSGPVNAVKDFKNSVSSFVEDTKKKLFDWSSPFKKIDEEFNNN